MNQLVCLQVKDQDLRVFFCGGEQAIARFIQSEMIEVAVVKLWQWVDSTSSKSGLSSLNAVSANAINATNTNITFKFFISPPKICQPIRTEYHLLKQKLGQCPTYQLIRTHMKQALIRG